MSDDPVDPKGEIRLSKHSQESIERERRQGILAEQFKLDLLTHPRYKKFFSAYEPSDVTNFIEEYSWRKALYLEHGENYIELMESDEDGDLQYPDWYAFYDVRFGTGMLSKLMDIRGEKEEFYRGLCFDAEHPDFDSLNGKPPEGEKLLRIGYGNMEFFETFMKEFEDEKLLRYFRAITSYDKRHDDEDLRNAVEMLKCADEPVPIDAADDWREGIIKAADRFRRERLADGVRSAYRDYLMRSKSGLFLQEEDKDDYMDGLRKGVKEDIIKGRVLNGEPPDLNF